MPTIPWPRAVGELAIVLGAGAPGNVIYCVGATEALNLAIAGLRLPHGAHVVTTALEHTSVLGPQVHLQHDGGTLLSIGV